MLKQIIILLFIVFISSGCFNSKKETKLGCKNEYIIRVGTSVVTEEDFLKALETTKITYLRDELHDTKLLKNVYLSMINQLTEEMILSERAKELKLEISAAELEKKILKIKKDYPNDFFEQELLESAVSFNHWKKQLKNRLLMEKVIEQELAHRLTVTPEDITNYYKKHLSKNGLSSIAIASNENGVTNNLDINRLIIENIKREKVEKKYSKWLQGLKQIYKIEININKLKKIIDS